eukprot:2232627-Heterocapsa_arctica.AAC.1
MLTTVTKNLERMYEMHMYDTSSRRRVEEEIAAKSYELIGFPFGETTEQKYRMVSFICEKSGVPIHSVAGYQFLSGDKERCVIAFRDA